MKHKLSISITLIVLTSIICMSQKKAEKVTYEFPAEMAEPVRKEFTKLCDKFSTSLIGGVS